jgi:tripartite-type tricarboxylate transporter receptor subunit TctC
MIHKNIAARSLFFASGLTRRMILAVACLSLAQQAIAQPYPSKPIRVVIPIASGSSGDILLRQVLPKMSAILGQSMFVDNRTGAGGQIGTAAVTKATPDGYTLLFGYSQVIAVNPSLYKNLSYDPITELTPVGRVASQPLVFAVSNKLPVKSVAEFVAHGKANRGKLSYASSGSGTSGHLAGAYVSQLTDIAALHVPYNVVPQALIDLTSGDIKFMMYPYPGLLPALQRGGVNAIAVTGPRRSSFLPALPTMVELGYDDFVIGPWYAFYAPAGTPKDAVDKLNSALNKVLADKEIQKLFADSATDPWPSTPEELGHFSVSEIERYRKLVKISGATAE